MRFVSAAFRTPSVALLSAAGCVGVCFMLLVSPAFGKAAKPAKKTAVPAAKVMPVGPPWPPAVKEVAKPAERVVFSSMAIAQPQIAMTFDDGPHPQHTPRLLDILRERNIKATFFVLGSCVKQNPGVLRRIQAEGHEIGNHSWKHPVLSGLKEPKIFDELEQTQDVVEGVTGIRMNLMRPPYGALTLSQKWWVNRVWNHRVILWDVDSLDWQHHDPLKTQRIILETTKPGSIILCHDIHGTTIDAMPATLDALTAKGFSFVTVSELLANPTVPPPAPAVTKPPGKKPATTAPAGTPSAPASTPSVPPAPSRAKGPAVN